MVEEKNLLGTSHERLCWKIVLKNWNEDELINYLIGQQNAINGLTNNLNQWIESYKKKGNE